MKTTTIKEVEAIVNTENEIRVNRTFKAPARGKHCNGNTKATIIIDDGLVFTSALDTAEHMNVSTVAISRACRVEGATCKGKKIFYASELPNHVDELCEVIQRLKRENEALRADAKGMEMEINELRAREAKRQKADELRRQLAEIEKELEVM